MFADPRRAPSEGFCTAGVQTEAGVADLRWVADRGILVASDSGKPRGRPPFPPPFSPPFPAPPAVSPGEAGTAPLCPAGAVELWELDENETLIVNKFCKYEHDDIVTTVAVLAGSTQVVSGGQDFW